MAKKIWKSGAISIIALPSGEQGKQILDLAEEWSRSWLLTPALWMLPEEIPSIDTTQDLDLQVPPALSAYLLGRDSEQQSVREKVDVFWTLGSQQFEKIRFIAVRTEQDYDLMERTSQSAEAAANFIERSVPKVTDMSRENVTGVSFYKYNLVIAPTNERRLLQGVLSEFWDKNLVAAAEDRSTPLSTDSFVKLGERFIGFALSHIATTAGLWSGLPIGSAEIDGDRTQLRQARLQRVFVRGVTNDALSAEVAHWALQKLNYTDTNFDIGVMEGKNVTTISSDMEDLKIEELVDFILKGPEGKEENFLYQEYPDPIFPEIRIPLGRRIVRRIQDMAEGLGAIYKWLKASAEYRIESAVDDNRDDKILERALPERLAPRITLPKVDLLKASLRPVIQSASPELWTHLRESISASIDAPDNNHPSVLRDPKDDRLLVFSTIDRVLPNPEVSWLSEAFKEGTAVRFEDISWLDTAKAKETIEKVNARINELAPGIEDASNQLSETLARVEEAKREFRIVREDIQLIEKELADDLALAGQIGKGHTHELPEEITGPVRKPGQKVRRINPRAILEGKKKDESNPYVPNEVEGIISLPRKSIWKRLFGLRGNE